MPDTLSRLSAGLADPPFRATLPSTGVGYPTQLSRRGAGRYVGWVAAVVLSGAAARGWLRLGPTPQVARYGLALPADQRFRDSNHPGFALSPDGTWIVYQGPAESGVQLWIKERDRFEAVPVPGTTNWASGLAPAVSPDGTRLAVALRGQDGGDIYVKDLDRGRISRLTFDPAQDTRPRWMPDGRSVACPARRHDR